MLLSKLRISLLLLSAFVIIAAVSQLIHAGENPGSSLNSEKILVRSPIEFDGLALPLPDETMRQENADGCQKGWKAYLEGDIKAARDEFYKALQEDSKNPYAYFGAETLATGEGRYREAFSRAMEATRFAGETPWYEVFLADAVKLMTFAENPERLVKVLQQLIKREDISTLNRLITNNALAEVYEKSGNPEEAIEVRSKLPFIREWRLLGPFNNREKAGFEEEYGAEISLPAIDLEMEYEGRNGQIKWLRPLPLADNGYLNLSAMLYPHEENITYACTHLEVDEDTAATLIFGSGGIGEIWVNGVKTWAWKSYLSYHPFQRLFPITLQKGVTQIVIKSGGERGAHFGLSMMVVPGTIEEISSIPAKAGINPKSIRVALDKPVQVTSTPEKSEEAPRSEIVADDDIGLNWGAMGFFKDYLEKNPRNPMALTGLGFLYLHRGLDDKYNLRSRPLFETAAVVAPHCPLFLGLASFVQQDANEVREYLRKALASHKDETMATEELMKQYYNGGLMREAETMARTVLERLPSAEAYKTIAQIQSHRQWLPEARENLKEALKLKPGELSLYTMLAKLAVGETEKIEILRQGVSRTGAHSLRRALVLELLSKDSVKIDELVQPLRINLALNPYSLEDYLLLRDCYLRGGDLAKAQAVLAEALTRLPEQPLLLDSVGRLEMLQGNDEAAIAHWKKSLTIAPDNPRLREYHEEIEPKRVTFYKNYEILQQEIIDNKPDISAYARYNTVTLLDQGVTRVNPNGTSDQMIHFTQMALTQKGAQQLSRYSIGYDPQRERVEVLSAQVIQPDGSIISSSDIHDQSGSYGGDGGVYSKYYYKSISLPQVLPMSIIDIKYLTEATGQNLYGNDFEDTFFFGSHSPTLRFQYVLDTPVELKTHVGTYRKEDIGVTEETSTSDGRLVRKWNGKDLPGVEMEPAMPPFEEIAPSLRASTFDSWEDVGTWYWNLSKDYFELPDSIVEATRELVVNAETEEEKLAEIYYHVIDKVRYVGIELGRNGYVPHKAERTYRTTYGDCKDTAVLFVSLLKAVGIEARVALVRTWDRGREPTGVPGAQRFNHAICYVPDVNGKDYWLDGTTDYNHFSELPTMDQGAVALISTPSGGTYTTIPEDPASANGETIDCTIMIDPKNLASINARFNASGAYAPSRRAAFEAPDAMRKNFENFIKRLFAGAELKDFATSKPDLREKKAFFDVRITVPKMAIESSQGKRLKPCFLPQKYSSRFAVQNERKHDLILNLKRFRRIKLQLILPEGAKVTDLPENLDLDLPFGKLYRETKVEGNTVYFEMETQIKLRRIELKDYPEWRSFCHKVDAAEEEWIVYE